MSSEIKGRLFIVGCPRSGTTLLQSLLAAHPQITSFPESHFFESLAPANPFIKNLGIGLASGQRSQKRFKRFLSIIHQEKMEEYLPSFPLFINQYVSAFVQILDKLTQEKGKSLWIEKTPGHLYQIPLIQQMVEGAKFIHIIRNGSDVVASLYEVTQKHPEIWGDEWTLEQCIRQWKKDIEITQIYFSQPNHTLVKYEQLVENPQVVLMKLCEFLEVSFDEVMLQEYGTASKGLIRKDESWKTSVGMPIRSANNHKFYQVFDEKQRQHILNEISMVDIEAIFSSASFV